MVVCVKGRLFMHIWNMLMVQKLIDQKSQNPCTHAPAPKDRPG